MTQITITQIEINQKEIIWLTLTTIITTKSEITITKL